MTVITTRLVIAPDGSISLAEALPAGEYVATVERVDQPSSGLTPLTMEDFPQLNVGPFPKGMTFSREEIYGDDGR